MILVRHRLDANVLVTALPPKSNPLCAGNRRGTFKKSVCYEFRNCIGFEPLTIAYKMTLGSYACTDQSRPKSINTIVCKKIFLSFPGYNIQCVCSQLFKLLSKAPLPSLYKVMDQTITNLFKI